MSYGQAYSTNNKAQTCETSKTGTGMKFNCNYFCCGLTPLYEVGKKVFLHKRFEKIFLLELSK